MTEVLPPPPRHVHRRAIFATWWPFGVVACALLLVAVAVPIATWAGDGFRSPRTDWRIDDADTRAYARATVEATDAAGAADRRAGECEYSFADAEGSAYRGRARLLPAPGVGTRLQVEYLPEDPAVNRPAGERTDTARLLSWFGPRVLLPALMLALFWFVLVYQTWVTMRHGTAMPVTLIARRDLPLLGTWVRYRFVDDTGARREGGQLVGAGSPLQGELRNAPPDAPLAAAFVVFRGGLRHRLVTADDVARAPA